MTPLTPDTTWCIINAVTWSLFDENRNNRTELKSKKDVNAKKETATVPSESAGTAFDKKRNGAKKNAFCAANAV